ncbi:8495_t:CDS:2 [Scutellospora calospora]|uniref:8495_t:CDS:1 n=1 Tax=Scutellospora calospora TaxID=85575 RepID=A0ACA9L2P4_9GLOM|nr:8495_t:CDS:2 [Scutellospora calospora]
MAINVEKLKDASEAYSDFLSTKKITILIHSPSGTWKTTALREIIMALKDKIESLFHFEFTACLFVAIFDEVNAIMYQMSSDTNAQKSENTICDILRFARHVLAIDAFANESTLAFLKAYYVKILYDPSSRAEAIRIGELDCIAYTNAVEAGILFEVMGYFDIVIAITNIATSVHIEALAQMLYRIHDFSHRHKNIRAELESSQPNNLPINLGSEEAENLKFNQKRSILFTIALKQCFSLSEPWKHFLYLSHFQKQGCDEDSTIEAIPNLNSAIKAYDGLGFEDKGAPELLLYRLNTDNEVQKLFDSKR